MFFNSVITNNTVYSYDCVNIETRAGIQIKSV